MSFRDLRPLVAARLRQLLADPGPKGPTVSVNQTPGDLVGDAPITVSLAQIDALRNQIKQAQQEAADLRTTLEAVKRGDPAGDVSKLERLSRAMLVIVRFALANLPPSDIPKWPRDSVRFIADHLAVLPEFSVDDETLVAELKLFVREIEEHEMRHGGKDPGHKALEYQPPKRSVRAIEAELNDIRGGRAFRHGPKQRGGSGPCEPDCIKCALEKELEEAQRLEDAAR